MVAKTHLLLYGLYVKLKNTIIYKVLFVSIDLEVYDKSQLSLTKYFCDGITLVRKHLSMGCNKCHLDHGDMAALQKLIVIFLIHGASSLCSNSPKRFVTHPVNVDVKEGQNVTFTCVVSNFNEGTDSITWYVNPSLYDRTDTLSFNEKTREMASTLTVLNVGREPQAHYCVLIALDDQFNVHMCHSKTGTLHVQYFSDEDEMKCGPKDQLVFEEKEIMQAWCNITSLDPSMRVEWYLDNATIASSSSLPQDTNHALQQTFEVTREFHNKDLSCAISSPSVFPGQEISCSIGPFVVREKPISTLMPGVLNISPEYVDGMEEIWNDRNHLENILNKDFEDTGSNYETSSEGSHARPLSNLDKTPTRRSFAMSMASLTQDGLIKIAGYKPTAANVLETDIPNRFTKTHFVTVIIGAVIAAVLLITCLFTVVIIILYMHFKQPQNSQRSITINDLQELHKFTSIIQREALQSYNFSDQSDYKPTEPAYDEPHLLTTLSKATMVGQEDQTNRPMGSYDSNIFDSRRPDSSSSLITVSWTGSHSSVDSGTTSGESGCESSPDLRFYKYDSNSDYGNQVVVDAEVSA